MWKIQFSIEILIKKSQSFLETFQNFRFWSSAQNLACRFVNFLCPMEIILQMLMIFHFSTNVSRFSPKRSISIKAIFEVFWKMSQLDNRIHRNFLWIYRVHLENVKILNIFSKKLRNSCKLCSIFARGFAPSPQRGKGAKPAPPNRKNCRRKG